MRAGNGGDRVGRLGDRDQAAFGESDGDGVAGCLGLPTEFAAILDDGFDHVGAEDAGALGDDHLAVWFFIEFDFDFDATLGAAFGPSVLDIVETDDFAFFKG